MAIRSHQFAAVHLTSYGLVDLFEVPAGQRALIKYTAMNSDESAPGAMILVIIDDATIVGVIQRVQEPEQYVLYTERQIYAVLDEGQKLAAFVGGSASEGTYIVAGGVLFDL